jgi:hypothetical protein
MTQDEAVQKLNITVDLLPQGASNRPGTKISPTHITIHNTSNNAKGADAAMHNQYIKGADARARQVSWHFTVDDKRTFKHLPTNEKGWHAGKGNPVSIGIEVCENQGIDKDAVLDRAALLTALMMLAYRIPRDNIQPHQFWTGKDCPRVILRQPGKFEAFRDRAAGFLAQLKGGPAGGVAPMGMAPEEITGDSFEAFGDDTVGPELAALIDVGEEPSMGFAPQGFAPQGASGGEDQVALMERMIGRLTMENFALRQALESQGMAMGVEPEAD